MNEQSTGFVIAFKYISPIFPIRHERLVSSTKSVIASRTICVPPSHLSFGLHRALNRPPDIRIPIVTEISKISREKFKSELSLPAHAGKCDGTTGPWHTWYTTITSLYYSRALHGVCKAQSCGPPWFLRIESGLEAIGSDTDANRCNGYSVGNSYSTEFLSHMWRTHVRNSAVVLRDKVKRVRISGVSFSQHNEQ